LFSSSENGLSHRGLGLRRLTPMETVWAVVIGILLLMWVANRFVKASQQAKGRGRCVYCRARLKFMGVGVAGQAGVNAGYAKVCSKCGREQPWASGEAAVASSPHSEEGRLRVCPVLQVEGAR
jgi:hypothetical protein